MPRREIELPSVPGILSSDQILATARSIARMQEPSGAIPWPDGHTDSWDHVECAMALTVCGLTTASRRAYEWLRRSQRSDGAWPKKTVSGTVTDSAVESNQVAYVAVGVWHELQVTRDDGFAVRMWPMVRQAISFVLRLQTERGEIIWERKSDGSPASYALLTGCSSTYQSLRCAVALAEYLGEPQPDWELAADQLGHVIIEHPEAFADKSRFSMDWYYPVLGGAVRGEAARRRLADGWSEFVVPDLGVRCVRDEPWITGAETCELVLALDAIDDRERALAVYDAVQHLRDTSGAYWTGWQFENRQHFPAERSSWTAAAVVLAADALSAASGGSDLFRKAGGVPVPDVPEPGVPAPVRVPGLAADAAVCGCATPGPSQQPASASASADAVTGPLQNPQ